LITQFTASAATSVKNTATGAQALGADTTGSFNTADGAAALFSNTSGSNNTAVGYQAGFSITTGTNNIALGANAGSSLNPGGSNNIVIGNPGQAGDNGIIRLGQAGLHTTAYIAGAITGNGSGLTSLNAAQLTGIIPPGVLPGIVLTNGELGVTLSGSFSGNGNGLTSLNAGAITTGTLPLSVLPSVVLTNNESSASFGSLSLSGSINLPATTPTVGQITMGGVPVLQTYNGNFFAGGAGNLTLTGVENAGAGANALAGLTSGYDNTAAGFHALMTDNVGHDNTANGALALAHNSAGSQNTAVGSGAMFFNTIGLYDTANGALALYYNVDGSFNAANGTAALYLNISGSYNAAHGVGALEDNTLGSFNTGDGALALLNNTTGNGNTAVGYQAGYGLTNGTNNIFLGANAGYNVNAAGGNMNNIEIGNAGQPGDNGTIRIGDPGLHSTTYVAGILHGNGSGLTKLDATQLTGTIPPPALPPVVVTNGEAQALLGTLTLTGLLDLPVSGASVGMVRIGGIPMLEAHNDNFFACGTSNFAVRGTENLGIGKNALTSDIFGSGNTAVGFKALSFNEGSVYNTAVGDQALSTNDGGSFNTADGAQALFSNSTGSYDTGIGYEALYLDVTGSFNTADGFQALYSNTNGNFNIALGYQAGANLTTGDNNIEIGNLGSDGESGIIRIGTPGRQTATLIAGISGMTVPAGAAVYVSPEGQLGTLTSSARFKENIQEMEQASQSIFKLRPVTFRYKPDIDSRGVPQFGLVAEEVDKIDPALVTRDADGRPYTVRYEAVNAMLLNEFIKEHQEVREQAARIRDLQERLEKLEHVLEAGTVDVK
jgi:hypothetical protein